MLAKSESKPLMFFAKVVPAQQHVELAKVKLLKQLDFTLFQEQSLALIKANSSEENYWQWQLFCRHVKQLNASKSEKMLLMQTAFQCLDHPLEPGHLAQLLTLTSHLKSVDGLELLQLILQAQVPKPERQLQTYLAVFQLLLDLHEVASLFELVITTLPQLNSLLEKLRALHGEYLTAKYPERNIDAVIACFAKQDELVQFPLQAAELATMKQDYMVVKNYLTTLKTIPQGALQDSLVTYAREWREKTDNRAKHQMLAIIAETIRRTYGILPYDTQILSLLALINSPDKLKGRIAQIKTGEGKSTIIAMLAAFMGAQGFFVDMVTSSGYLAIRDCKKYLPFFKALGLAVSHISHHQPKQKHFHAQILYGTNTDFEFSLLRDGLHNLQLRRSRRFNGDLSERLFEVVIIDEVDNLFLDTAMSSAQMGICDHSNTTWIYEPILRFVQSHPKDVLVTPVLLGQLRDYLAQKQPKQSLNCNDSQLKRWFESAHTACYKKTLDKDYLVTIRKDKAYSRATPELEIVIVDYAYTGRTNEGSQWQHGIHQFLQIKHGLKLTPPTKTGASVAHPTFFNLYQYILGLTGTMGEAIERQEIQTIYQVDSFDVPPHRPSLRQRAPDFIWPNRVAKWQFLLQQSLELRQQGLPVLLLFKTIEESNGFSQYLNSKKLKHQLLNETQRESEDYLVAQAGEPGVITVATNTAGRGTDIILAPKSHENGGLQMVFAFYPDNIRVEGQGFGRAGRQGNPGRCWMVLDLEDEALQSLLTLQPLESLNNLIRVKLATDINQHLALQAQSTKPISVASIMPRLNELRTSRIQQQSLQRSECARQEQLYFGKLQHFFSKMARVYALVETKSFKDQIVQHSSSGFDQEQSMIALDEHNPNWLSLKEMAVLLLNQSQQGIVVDWQAFAERFKDTYLRHICELWASYYSKLKDAIEDEVSRERAWHAVDAYLSAPEKMAMLLLNTLFSSENRLESSSSVSMCQPYACT